MSIPLEDYALIGDCETAALISREGSIDWLCLPRFDSGACFAALLGSDENGFWKIAPAGEVKKRAWRYRERSLVLETEYETPDGAALVSDFMPLRDERAELIRVVSGKSGSVRMRLELKIRFDYGSVIPWVQRTADGITAIAGPDMLHLTSPVELINRDFRSWADFVVREGQTLAFDLKWFPSHRPEPEKSDAIAALESTDKWWKSWLACCRYSNLPWTDAVERSLITLKALTYMPTGGIVAAPTTSLPELVGGTRNWDYRFSWLRDATLTLYALMLGGFTNEADCWRKWLLRAAAGCPEEMQIMYGLAGERRLDERELPWLSGYEHSRPVRTGNAAHSQLQLDVYGEVIDALYQAVTNGLTLAPSSWRMQRAMLRFLQNAWLEPDEGIWEVRGPRRHFTHSKMMCWVAFDRAIKSIEHFHVDGPLDDWRRIRDQIHKDICQKAFDKGSGCFVQYYGGKLLDASLLLMPETGFLPVSDPRVKATIESIQRRLCSNGFVRRYEHDPAIDGIAETEGAFLPCSFWLVDCLQLLGRHAEALEQFERLLAVRNDLGLLGEQYDAVSKRQIGNYPQAFTHVALINSAMNLAEARGPAEKRQRS